MNAVDMAQTVTDPTDQFDPNNYLDLYLPKRPFYFSDYAYAACAYLDILSLSGKEIIISLKKYLESDAYGICFGDDESVEIHIALTQFGKPISRQDKLSTLGHELVHAKQYLLGHLQNAVDGDNEMGVWKGTRYLWTDNSDELPWEQEAYRLEKEIYEYCTGTRSTNVSRV